LVIEGHMMANEEHVALIKQGANAWNAWRRENPDVVPDLNEAIISGVDLQKADLHMAMMGGADLHGAYLSNADLRDVDLIGAKLCGARVRTHNQ
jgi:uncharacterized protein YjbI with pentapeptide repeats